MRILGFLYFNVNPLSLCACAYGEVFSVHPPAIRVTWAKRVRCVPRLWTDCTAQVCVVSGCPVYNPRRFSGIVSRKPKSPPFLRCRLPRAPTRLPLRSRPLRSWRWRWRCCRPVFFVGLRSYRHPSFDRHSNRSFLFVRIADFVVDAVDVVDVSVSEFVPSAPGEHLAFSGIVLMYRQIRVARSKRSLGPSPFKRRTQCLAFCIRSARVAV